MILVRDHSMIVFRFVSVGVGGTLLDSTFRHPFTMSLALIKKDVRRNYSCPRFEAPTYKSQKPDASGFCDFDPGFYLEPKWFLSLSFI